MDANKKGFLSAARLKAEAKGAIVGLLTMILLLLLFSTLVLWISVPLKWISVFSYAALVLGVFVGGFISGRYRGR